jgi:WhiB family redox-sensing transcriptional regulator
MNPFIFPIVDDAQNWRHDASCAQTDPEAFFVGKGGDPRPAKKICNLCPVVEPCLMHALQRGEAGIWGGTTERERRHLAKERGIAPIQHWEHGDPGGAARHRREGTTPCAICLRTETVQANITRQRRQEQERRA